MRVPVKYTAAIKDQILGFFHSKKRFNINHSGRRSNKTLISKYRLGQRLLGAHDPTSSYYIKDNTRPNFFCGAPTQEQAHRIFWEDMIAIIGKRFIREVNISKHYIELISGVRCYVLGMDAPERWEGVMWYGGIIDEYGNAKPDVLDKHIFPCIGDTHGYLDFIGVPEGTGNHYYKLVQDAAKFPEDWDVWHWHSKEVMDPVEVERAKQRMDEATYNQEYGGEFITFQGRAYYAFQRDLHLHKVIYKPDQPIEVMFDFNISPGVAVFAQECQKGQVPSLPDFTETGCLGEVWIAKGSNTELVCDKIIQMLRSHQGLFLIDGDATGGARHSSSDKTNWELVRKKFASAFPNRFQVLTPRSNPHERDRINAMNSRLKSMDGQIHIVIDPDKCPHLIEDLEGVCLDKRGELNDKAPYEMLTHISDALGYYVARKFPVLQYVATTQRYWK